MKNWVKKLIGVLILVFMVAGLVPAAGLAGTVKAEEAYFAKNVNKGKATDYSGMPKELHIHGSGDDTMVFQPWTGTDSLPDTAGSYYLTKDVELSGSWRVPSDETNLCLNGHKIEAKCTNDNKFAVITVGAGRTLNLYDCGKEKHKYTVSNGLATVDDEAAGEEGEDYYTFTGGSITGGKGTSEDGGGIYINQGTVGMNGGTIIGNSVVGMGGGVCAEGESASFTMNGGSIIYNTATEESGGGVNVWSYAKFNMTGGAITNNTANKDGGGVSMGYNSEFNMTGGAITNNTAYNDGGGVNISGADTGIAFNMTGGAITNNTANGSDGGGVWVDEDANFTVSGAPRITGNKTGGSDRNVYLAKTSNTQSKITVGGELTGENDSKANIGITMDTPGVFTNGWKEKMGDADPAEFFTSDSTDYFVMKASDEANLGVKVTFKANYDNGPDDVTQDIPCNTETELTKNTFERTGYTFGGWNTNKEGAGDKYADKAPVTLTQNTILYAQWDKKPVAPQPTDMKTTRAKALKTKLLKVKNKAGRKVVVKWAKAAGISASGAKAVGYQVRYSLKKNFKKKTKIKKINKPGITKITLKKLKKGKVYYIQVRPVTKVTNLATGKSRIIYGRWSNKKKVRIKK